jgi:hypothetical protein
MTHEHTSAGGQDGEEHPCLGGCGEVTLNEPDGPTP